MAVTWQSQPNSACCNQRRRRLASGPPVQTDLPRPIKLRPPATPFLRRRSTAGYRVASLDVVLANDGVRSRRSYALFSPYAPLPAIGVDAKVAAGDETVMDTVSDKKSPPPRPRLLRERTYSVIEPVLVRGPSVTSSPQWAQPVRVNNAAWPPIKDIASSPPSERKPRQSDKRSHSSAWSQQPEPLSPQLPSLMTLSDVTETRRASSPEMLDDVQLPPFPPDIDLDADDLSTEEPAVLGDAERPRDLNVTWTLPRRTSEAAEETSEEPQASNKLVNEVTDSLKRMWTRL